MCLVCCTRPIASIAYFTTGNLGTFRMSARAKKRLWGGRPRSEDHRPTTFFRLSRRHPTLPRLPFVPCAHEAIVLGQKAVSESIPYGGSHGGKNRPRHRKGTRAYSRLTDINPYSAPVIRGHMCLVCYKSRFPSCSPLAGGEQSEKTITDTPRLLAVFQVPVVLAARKTKPLGSMINRRPKSGDMR